MEITAATVWDDAQIARWAALNGSVGRVTTVFGSRREQVVGHGRSPDDVPEVSDARIEEHSAVSRRVGLKFFYLLNGRCEHINLGDLETQRQVLDDVEWIASAVRATGVVVADLGLARLIRSKYSKDLLAIRVSTVAGVRTAKQLEPWLELDIDGVVLHHDLGRDFLGLTRLGDYLRDRAPDVRLELLLNESCLHGCASRVAHYARLASAPRGYVEGFQQGCNLPKFQDPSLLLSANWIRPEDTHYYEQLGITRFKIAGREMSRMWLDRAVSAYADGRYEGNLVDLLTITPPGLNVEASDIFFVSNPSLAGLVQQARSWKGARLEFYSCLADRLWQQGDLRVHDPDASYEASDGRPRCREPGRHQQTLCSLLALTDPAYRTRKERQA